MSLRFRIIVRLYQEVYFIQHGNIETLLCDISITSICIYDDYCHWLEAHTLVALCHVEMDSHIAAVLLSTVFFSL